MSAVAEVAAALRVQADALEAQARALRAQAGALEAAASAPMTPPPSSSSSRSPLLDKRELARQLRVSAATVDRLDREGQPFLRVGDAKRYDLAAVHAWHRERSATAAPPALPPGPEPSGVRLLSGRRRGAR